MVRRAQAIRTSDYTDTDWHEGGQIVEFEPANQEIEVKPVKHPRPGINVDGPSQRHNINIALTGIADPTLDPAARSRPIYHDLQGRPATPTTPGLLIETTPTTTRLILNR